MERLMIPNPVDFEYELIIIERDGTICLRIEGNDVWLPKHDIEMDRDAKIVTMSNTDARIKGLL
jgi:hypothetical protein